MPEPVDEKKQVCHVCGNAAYRVCATCEQGYCLNDVSNIDLAQCRICCESARIEVLKVSKRDVDYDLDEDIVKTTLHKATHYHFSGEHWLTNSIILHDLPDDVFKSVYQYHKGMVLQLEDELTRRKIQKARAYAAASSKSGRKVISSAVVSSTKTTRSKVITPDTFMELVQKSGMSVEKLIEMLQKKAAGG